ncbi:uncharacterized protein PHACADRAFT_184959 [Phanerochaete carnosa HHB-10118-sp]|uniref:Uncharacterized protein n=1 Tax=Phanerochaete carnosa (strain HHB-10118-sp) TaxID=650164 RepID=K5VR51_PHACS|nr:uncharacterized protein PHACADRAFT_184959 [Phanerochaete carnosa HHB-10118-sp]EKM53943.1 hypothetical protein PHACADRAFT_184959 [Phanerochaete carnosa HHB-10118-sp]
MAIAWPRLEQLVLGYNLSYGGQAYSDPYIYIDDLYPFAQHCLSLRRLSISIADSIDTPKPLSYDETPAVHHNLQELDLACSRIRTQLGWARVAGFTLAVFPRARDGFKIHERQAKKEIQLRMNCEVALSETVWVPLLCLHVIEPEPTNLSAACVAAMYSELEN